MWAHYDASDLFGRITNGPDATDCTHITGYTHFTDCTHQNALL